MPPHFTYGKELTAMAHKQPADTGPPVRAGNGERLAALLKRYQAGDQDAMRELYERYNRPILTYVRYQLRQRARRRRRCDSPELVDAVFLAIVKTLNEGKTFLDEETFFA